MMQSPSVHQFQERARINDLNVMPLRDEVFGLSMGCAFCVTGENTRVLISDNQQRHLFGYSFDSDDAKFCGQVFGCVACDREHAGEYGDMSCQSACRIDLGGACGDGTFPMNSGHAFRAIWTLSIQWIPALTCRAFSAAAAMARLSNVLCWITG